MFEAELPEAELDRYAGVVAFASFRDDALDEHADVVFAAHLQEGTVTHPDGRVQRVRQALGQRGESRPAWWFSPTCASAPAPFRARSARRW